MTKRETPSVEFLDIDTFRQPEFPGLSPVPLTIQTVRTVKDLAALENEWNALVDRADVTVYQTFDWQRLWWKHFCSGPFITMFVLVVRRNRDLLGIAPFCIRSELFLGFRLRRRLELMGGEVPEGPQAPRVAMGGPSDYLDIIVAPGNEHEVATSLVKFLRTHSDSFDDVVFNNVPERSVLLGPFLTALDAAGMKSSVRTSDVCPRVEVPSSMKEFISGLEAHVGRRMRRSMNNFKGQPSKAIHHITTQKEFDSAYRDLIALHQMRWNRLGYLGLFADDRFRAFQAEVGRVFLKRGWLWFKTASMAGVRVGARMGFMFKDRMYDYLSGFDDRSPWARSRPGLALLATMLDDAIRSRFRVLDLLRGGEEYKFELTSNVCYNRTISIKFLNHRSLRLARMAQVIAGSREVFHRIQREAIIIRLHLAEHGLMPALPAYLTFLKSRVFRKQTIVRANDNMVSQIVIGARLRAIPAWLTENARSVGHKIIHGSEDFASRLFARVYLWNCNVVGENARVIGRPIIRNGGRIKIGDDVFLNSGVLRTTLMTGRNGHIEIGHGVRIGFGTSIAAQELIKIGNRVRIGHSVTILDTDDQEPKKWYSAMKAEEVLIEDDVLIGDRVTILKGARITRGSVIQEGSIVSGSTHGSGMSTHRRGFPSSGERSATGRRQRLVNNYFDLNAPYWQDIYGSDSLDGLIYRLRSGEVLASVEMLNLPRRSKVLEVGCGAGLLTIGLARKELMVTAIDSSETMVELATARLAETGFLESVTVRREDVHTLNEPDGTFDLAVVVGVIPWLHSPERALREIVRVTKPGGFLLVTFDNRWRLNHLIDPRLSPVFSPVRSWFKWLLGYPGYSKSPQEIPPAAMHSPRWADRFLKSLGTTKVWSKTVGFGPFTLWGKMLFSDRVGIRLHTVLQSLADIGLPVLRLTGSHYLIQVQKSTRPSPRGFQEF